MLNVIFHIGNLPVSNAKAVCLRLVAQRPIPRPTRPAVSLQLDTDRLLGSEI